jgi:hypothetical protein
MTSKSVMRNAQSILRSLSNVIAQLGASANGIIRISAMLRSKQGALLRVLSPQEDSQAVGQCFV